MHFGGGGKMKTNGFDTMQTEVLLVSAMISADVVYAAVANVLRQAAMMIEKQTFQCDVEKVHTGDRG